MRRESGYLDPGPLINDDVVYAWDDVIQQGSRNGLLRDYRPRPVVEWEPVCVVNGVDPFVGAARAARSAVQVQRALQPWRAYCRARVRMFEVRNNWVRRLPIEVLA